tara:strand:- start:94 stop:300 length:207 start_codon:yes stop_codon:yes gene_type:complete
MPTYKYRCQSCHYEFETVQSMLDDPLTDCTKCNGQVMRIIQLAGVQFKGSGFYVNDSKSTASSSTAND